MNTVQSPNILLHTAQCYVAICSYFLVVSFSFETYAPVIKLKSYMRFSLQNLMSYMLLETVSISTPQMFTSSSTNLCFKMLSSHKYKYYRVSVRFCGTFTITI